MNASFTSPQPLPPMLGPRRLSSAPAERSGLLHQAKPSARFARLAERVRPENRAALEERFPGLVARLAGDLPSAPVPESRATLSGDLGLVLSGSAIVSELDPRAEARAAVERYDLGGASRVLCLAFGAGHLVEAVLEQAAPSTRVEVAVVDPGSFLLSLSLRDLSPALADPRLRLVVGDAREQREALGLPADEHLPGAGTDAPVAIVSGPLLGAASPELAPLIKSVRRLERAQRVHTERYERVAAHVAANLDAALAAPRAAALVGALAGRPALLVAPGPGLDEGLDVLARAKPPRPSLAILEPALPAAVARGLLPDLRIALEPGEPFDPRQRRLDEELADVPLLFAECARPELVAAATRRYFVCERDGLLDRAHNLFGRAGTFGVWGTPLAAGLEILLFVGVNPVVVVGADLPSHSEGPFAGSARPALDAKRGEGAPGWHHHGRVRRVLRGAGPEQVLDASAEGGGLPDTKPVALSQWLARYRNLAQSGGPRPPASGGATPPGNAHERQLAALAARQAIARLSAEDVS